MVRRTSLQRLLTERTLPQDAGVRGILKAGAVDTRSWVFLFNIETFTSL